MPDELVALYAFADGFDLSSRANAHLIALSLVPSDSIDTYEAAGRYPIRAAIFTGEDELEISVYRDKKQAWWLVRDSDSVPDAKTPFDVRAILRFGIARAQATDEDDLAGALDWEKFFAGGSPEK